MLILLLSGWGDILAKQAEEVDLLGLFELTFPLGLTEAGTTESPGDAFYHDGMRPAMIATTHRAPYCLII